MFHTKKTFDYEHPLAESDICLLGVPFDSTEIGKSCKYGPLFIRQAIRELIGYNPRTNKNIFTEKKFTDVGDIEVVPGHWTKTQEKIIETLNDLFEENKNIVPVILGGEHLITLAVLRALTLKHDKITIIHFDAHCDLRKDWLGQKYSHLTWTRHALEELGNKIELIQIGQRQWDEQENEFLKKHAILSVPKVNEEQKNKDSKRIFNFSHVNSGKRKNSTEFVDIKQTLDNIKNPVYITMDLDVFNVVDVGTPEPGGITWEYFLSQIDKIKNKRIVGFDIVECAATAVGSKSAVLGANVFKELVGLLKKNEPES